MLMFYILKKEKKINKDWGLGRGPKLDYKPHRAVFQINNIRILKGENEVTFEHSICIICPQTIEKDL